jgi:hypothetical protein
MICRHKKHWIIGDCKYYKQECRGKSCKIYQAKVKESNKLVHLNQGKEV